MIRMLTELDRLVSDPPEGYHGLGTLVSIRIEADDVGTVVCRIKPVLRVVLEEQSGDKSFTHKLSFPRWFVDACLENEHESIPSEGGGRSMENWLFWMEPSEKIWEWWDVSIQDSNHARIRIVVHDWPTPLAALEWLIKTSGAKQIERS